MKNLLEYGFVSSDGYAQRGADGSYILAAKRSPIGEKFFCENPCYTFTSKGSFEFEEYLVIEYSAFGIKRPEDLARVMSIGVHAAVVGGAITRPKGITEDFVKAIKA